MKKTIALLLALVLGLSAFGVMSWHAHQTSSAPLTPSQSSIDYELGGGGTPTATSAPRPKTASPTPKPTAVVRRTNQRTPASRPLVLNVSSANTRPAQYLVLIVLDGARPDFFSLPGLQIPHLRALMQNGAQFSNAFTGLLESETPSGHASIGTGALPNQNGILSFDWAETNNTVVDLFDPARILDHSMENVLHNSGAASLASLVHKQNRQAKVVALSGHKYYAADAIGGPSADVIMYYTGTKDGHFVPVAVPGHVPPATVLNAPGITAATTQLPLGVEDHLAMTLATTTFEKMRPKVLMANIPEFDWPLGHPDGAMADPKDAKTLMQGFDQDLGRLESAYRKGGVLDRTLFVVTADHGFVTVQHHVPDTDLKKAVSAAGTSILSDTYHTAGYLWVRDKSKAPQGAANIAHLQNRYIQSVYFKENTATGYRYVRSTGADLLHAQGQEAANQFLLHSFIGPNGPDIAVFFTESAASEPGGQATWKGDHGGADWQSQHMPLIISGPGVRKGVVSSYPARLMDIAPTALTLMNVPVSGMTGIPLADIMQRHPAGALDRQKTQQRTLQPVVTSMQNEARLELAAGL